jgi:hypothetical protein
VAALANPRAFQQWLGTLYRRDWVVYAKPPFGGAEQVFRYLGRYTHRVAISNNRLLSLDNGQVRFRYKDYAADHRVKVMQLEAEEFIRRFLLHVLPRRFVRIRHYGLMAARNVPTKLARCRELLPPPAPQPAPPEKPKNWMDRLREWTGIDLRCCPRCQEPLTHYDFDAGTPPPQPVRSPAVPLRSEIDSS